MKARLLPVALAVCVCLSALPVVSAMAAVQAIPSTSSNAAVTGSAVVAEAERFLGYPYAYTGDSPATGFSCIGFVWYVYHELGMNIPGTNSGAVNAYTQVSEADLEPGDLVFFQGTVAGLYPSHVAIYIGGGKMIGADNPSYGVTISSFVNDPRDGNYWQDHYLSAERPWSGPMTPAGGPIFPRRHHVLTVVVPSINLRSGPSTLDSVLTVLIRGTRVTVEGWAPGWVRVATSEGTVGWLMRGGVARAFGFGERLGRRHAVLALGSRREAWANARTIYVYGLRVHSAPSLEAPVVVTLVRGNRVGVVVRYAGWAKIVTAQGITGWALSQYLGRSISSERSVAAGRTALRYGVNIRALPSMNAAILTVSNGAAVRVLRWSPGWAKVQLSNGTIGWVSRLFIGGLRTHAGNFAPRHRGFHTRRAGFGGGISVIAGVRVHTGPSLAASVIATTLATTRVRILGYRGGFTHVETSAGVVGWIASEFVTGGRSRARRQLRSAHVVHDRVASGAYAAATVRLHATASLYGSVLGVVYAGERVSILGSTVGWYYLRVHGLAGYVDAAYIRG